MQIRVNYCHMCGGIDQGKAIVEEIKRHYGLEPELVDVGRGRLEVEVNGEIIWQKKDQAGWTPFDIIKLMRRKYK